MVVIENSQKSHWDELHYSISIPSLNTRLYNKSYEPQILVTTNRINYKVSKITWKALKRHLSAPKLCELPSLEFQRDIEQEMWERYCPKNEVSSQCWWTVLNYCSCDQHPIEKNIISIRCWSQLRDRRVYDIKGS